MLSSLLEQIRCTNNYCEEGCPITGFGMTVADRVLRMRCGSFRAAVLLYTQAIEGFRLEPLTALSVGVHCNKFLLLSINLE